MKHSLAVTATLRYHVYMLSITKTNTLTFASVITYIHVFGKELITNGPKSYLYFNGIWGGFATI